MGVKIKFPKHCPVCGARCGMSEDEPLMQVGETVLIWMECREKHRFTTSFQVPQGIDIGLVLPGVSPQFQIRR